MWRVWIRRNVERRNVGRYERAGEISSARSTRVGGGCGVSYITRYRLFRIEGQRVANQKPVRFDSVGCSAHSGRGGCCRCLSRQLDHNRSLVLFNHTSCISESPKWPSGFVVNSIFAFIRDKRRLSIYLSPLANNFFQSVSLLSLWRNRRRRCKSRASLRRQNEKGRGVASFLPAW